MEDTITLFDKKNKKEKATLSFTIEFYSDIEDKLNQLAIQEDFF